MTENLPYGKHFRVKQGPFAGKVGLWDGVYKGAYSLAFPDRGGFGDKGNLWFKIADLEGPLSDKELEKAKVPA